MNSFGLIDIVSIFIPFNIHLREEEKIINLSTRTWPTTIIQIIRRYVKIPKQTKLLLNETLQNSPKRVSVPVLVKEGKSENSGGSALVSSSNTGGVASSAAGGGNNGNNGDNSCSTTLGTQPSPSSVGCRDDDCTPSPGPNTSSLISTGHLAAHLSPQVISISITYYNYKLLHSFNSAHRILIKLIKLLLIS